MSISNTLLPDWCGQSEWFEQEGHSLFGTRNRWDWFYRKHREDLVDVGAIGRIGNNVMVHRLRLRDALDTLIVGDAAGRIAQRKQNREEEVCGGIAHEHV